jgi:magnesium transporter
MVRTKYLADGLVCNMQARVWVDVETPTAEEIRALQNQYPINDMALADAKEIGHWSRFESYPSHLLLIFRTLEAPKAKSRTERISFFFFPEQQVLLTYRNEPVAYLEEAWQSFKGVANGSGCLWLWQKLLDRAVETFFDYADNLTEHLEDLEELALEGEGASTAHEVFSARREVLRVRRLASQARESLVHMERLPQLGSDAYLFRDPTDRMGRVYELLDAARDELSNILDISLAAQNNKLNKVVQSLTVISVLFLPLTLWAGIYGTNFESFSEYKWPLGSWFFWGGLVFIALSLSWWMKRQKWW